MSLRITCWVAVNGSRRKKPGSMVRILSCSDNPSGEACKRGLTENKAYAAALATSSVALLPGSAQAMWVLGAGINAGAQLASGSEINPLNSVAAGWINVITMGQGVRGTIAWNAAGGALTNVINGDDPLMSAPMI